MTRVVAAAGRLLRGLLALAVLFGLLGGVPWLLVLFVGWPLPEHMPSLGELGAALTSPLDDRKILNLLAILAWALWLLFLRDVLVEAILSVGEAADARRGRPRPPRRRPVGPVRLVAAVLVGAIAGAILLDALRGAVSNRATSAAAAANAAAHTPAVAVAPAQPAAVELPAANGPRPALATPARPSILATVTGITAHSGHSASDVPGWAQDAPGGIHRVVKGDNLWDIAKAKLGDPFRWREIYVLNRGKPQSNGYALTDPDEIHIGWVLVLPAHTPTAASPPAGTAGGNPAPAAPPVQSAPPATPRPQPRHRRAHYRQAGHQPRPPRRGRRTAPRPHPTRPPRRRPQRVSASMGSACRRRAGSASAWPPPSRSPPRCCACNGAGAPASATRSRSRRDRNPHRSPRRWPLWTRPALACSTCTAATRRCPGCCPSRHRSRRRSGWTRTAARSACSTCPALAWRCTVPAPSRPPVPFSPPCCPPAWCSTSPTGPSW